MSHCRNRARALCAYTLLLLFAGRPVHADEFKGEVFPKYAEDIYLRVTEEQGIAVENESMRYLSVEITLADGRIGVEHSRALGSESIVGPQGNLMTLYLDTEKEFREPRARNATITVLTGGLVGQENLTPEERRIHQYLVSRTVIEQVMVPIATSVLGVSEDKLLSKRTAQILQNLCIQNESILDDFMRAQSAAGAREAIQNILLRDLQSNGPITRALAEMLGVRVEGLAARLARRAIVDRLTGFLKFWKALERPRDIVAHFASWQQAYEAFETIRTTKAKLQFTVLFRKGVLNVYPGTVREDSSRPHVEFTVRGYGFAETPPPTVAFYEKGKDQPFHVMPPTRVRDTREMLVDLPMPALKDVRAGEILVQVRWPRESHYAPKPVLFSRELDFLSIDLPEAHPGQVVRIRGTFTPYVVMHEVYFQLDDVTRLRAPIDRAAHGILWVRVPDRAIAAEEQRWGVWIREDYGGSKAPATSRDKPLSIIVLPKHIDTVRREQVAAREYTWEIDGTIPAGQKHVRRAIRVPSGAIQLDGWFTQLAGPAGQSDRGVIKRWGFVGPLPNEPGKQGVFWLGRTIRDVRPNQLNSIASYTTSEHAAASRLIYLELQRDGDLPLSYRIRLRTRVRGDLGTIGDAGEYPWQAMDLPVRHPALKCHLFGDPVSDRTADKVDWFRIPRVDGNQELWVKLFGVSVLAAAGGPAPTIQSIQLFREGRDDDGRVELKEVDKHDGPIELQTDPFKLRAWHREEADYYVCVRHGNGNVGYAIEALVQPMTSPDVPSLPIASRFDRDDEGWRVVAGQQRIAGDIHEFDPGGNGFLRSRDRLGATALDLALVIDITGSMKDSLQNVRRAAEQLVQELNQQCPDMRVGLVGYSDLADSGPEGRPTVEFSSDAIRQMRTVGTWAPVSGNDYPEDTLEGVDRALGLGWRRDASVARVILVIGDAPTKLQNGKDRDGRTIAGIAERARRSDTQLFSVFVRNSDELTDEARRDFGALAHGSRGRMIEINGRDVSAAGATALAGPIRDATVEAVDAAHPRYWYAPKKFLGDVARFYGTNFAFRMRACGEGREISTHDIVVNGAHDVLIFRGDVTPAARPLDEIDKFAMRRIAVALSPRGRWTNRNGTAATEEQIRAVLANVKAIRIRAEYRAGPDTADIDDIVLGDRGEPTDAATDDQARLYLRDFDTKRRLVNDIADVISASSPEMNRRNERVLRAHNVKDPDSLARHYSERMREDESVRTARSTFHATCATWLTQLELRIRKRGTVTDAEREAYRTGLRSLTDTRALLVEASDKLIDGFATRAEDQQRMAKAGPRLRDELRRTIQSQETLDRTRKQYLITTATTFRLPAWPEEDD